MIPISLDPGLLSIGLAGIGPGLVRRLRLLRAGGAEAVAIFSPEPTPALVAAARRDLVRRLPEPHEIPGLSILWIVGLAAAEAERLAAFARTSRVLVNVEDVPQLCDFHNAAEIRRGDLLVTISTAGRAPGFAAALRRRLEAIIGSELAETLNTIADRREHWRRDGRGMVEVAALTEDAVSRSGWPA